MKRLLILTTVAFSLMGGTAFAKGVPSPHISAPRAPHISVPRIRSSVPHVSAPKSIYAPKTSLPKLTMPSILKAVVAADAKADAKVPSQAGK